MEREEKFGKREFVQGHCPVFVPITCGLGRRKGGKDKKGGLISHIQCISYHTTGAGLSSQSTNSG